MEIEHLGWDSDFFGYPVGKISVKESEIDLKISNIQGINKYKLIYLFAPFEINADERLIKKVDVKVELEKSILPKEIRIKTTPYNPNNHSFDELLRLVFLSGTYSRFNTDKNFNNQEFEKLYREWIIKSISSEKAEDVLVYLDSGRIAGFSTIERVNSITARIGLIGVHEEFQGRGIASCLICDSEFNSFKIGYSKLRVATQANNVPAINLYQKNGFVIHRISYIYHIWNL